MLAHDPATPAIYTLALHDALPISLNPFTTLDLNHVITTAGGNVVVSGGTGNLTSTSAGVIDRKGTGQTSTDAKTACAATCSGDISLAGDIVTAGANSTGVGRTAGA